MTTPIVVALGIKGGALRRPPCLVVAAILLLLMPVSSSRSCRTCRTGSVRLGERTDWVRWRCCSGVVTVRSVAWFGLITFVPLWINQQFRGLREPLARDHAPRGRGRHAAGEAADRFGRRPMLLVSSIVVRTIAVFILVDGVVGALSLVVISALGTFGVTMVMSQEYMPQHIGMAWPLDRPLDRPRRDSRPSPRGDRRLRRPRDSAMGVRLRADQGIVLTLLLPPTGSRRALAPAGSTRWPVIVFTDTDRR